MSDQPTEPILPPPPTAPPVAPAGPPPDAGPVNVVHGPEPKPKRPRPAIGLTGPSWVRPAFYYVACLLGILIGTWGAVNTAQGVVHLIAPDIAQQSDPITRFASTLVNLVDAGIESAGDEFEDELEDSGGEDALEGTEDIVDATKDELRSQARKGAIDELLGGLIFLGVGIVIYRYHWLRVEPEDEPTEPEDGADLAAS